MGILVQRLLFSFIFLTIGCSQEKTVVIPLKNEVSTFDPQQSYDMISNSITYQVYESLYTYDYLKRPYSIVPLLAQDLPSISKDKLTYTIKIRPGVKYHPSQYLPEGRTVTAHDFVTSLKRLSLPETKSRGWFLYQKKIKGLDNFRQKSITFEDIENHQVSGLKVLDELTLQIRLIQPLSLQQFLNLFALNFTSPLPLEGLLKASNDLELSTFGTGAYYISPQEKLITLYKFKDYITQAYPTSGDRYANEKLLLQDAGKKLPFIDKIICPIIPESLDRWKQLTSKKAHVTDLPPELFNQVVNITGKLNPPFQNMNLELFSASSMAYWWFEFNMNDPVVGSNNNLRKAIAHAIDRDLYVQQFTNAIDQVANSIFLPGILGYNPSYKFPYNYDLTKAKKYLELAGYPEGKGLPTLVFETRRDNEQHKEMAMFFQNSLAKVGIKVDYKLNTFSDFLDKTKMSSMQMWHGGWLMDYPDPENVLQLLYSRNALGKGPNKSNYINPEYDKLFQKYLISTDEEEQIQLLREIETLVHSDLPWILLNYSKNYFVFSKDLRNFRPNELIPGFYKFLNIK